MKIRTQVTLWRWVLGTPGSLCRAAHEQLALFVVYRLTKKRQEWHYKARTRTPRPRPRFVMALDALGCVAEKVARKADRVTPAP
jgi:hypothetical protein